MLVLSYYILEESQELKVRLTLIPICTGVILIVFGELSLNLLGFLCAFAANLSSASRIVFYKSKLKDTSNTSMPVSAFTTYLNVGFVSLILYIPFYTIQIIIGFFTHTNRQTNPDFINLKLDRSFIASFEFLIYGSMFNFLYNLFSLRVLANVAPISHSVINIMKRVFIVFCSMAVFSTSVTPLQWTGMIVADFGVFLYSLLKIKSQAIKVMISSERKSVYKKSIVYTVVIILVASCFIGTGNNHLSRHTILDKPESDSMRVKCIERVKNELKTVAKTLIPIDQPAHLLDIPQHANYGDTLIWYLKSLYYLVRKKVLF